MRKLASVQKISQLRPIPGADRIEVADVAGYHCVVKRGEFSPEQLVVFCEVDSILPPRPEFDFLKDRLYRVKTIKLRQQVSQGICFPITLLPVASYNEGDDVTEALGVKKYEVPEPGVGFHNLPKGSFPTFLHKTDETRIQSAQHVLDLYRGAPFVVREKLDGSSFTAFMKDGVFGVCSRNLELKDDEGSVFWRVAKEMKIEEALRGCGNYAVQGELVGHGVQGNKYKLLGQQVYIFNVYDIDARAYLDDERMSLFAAACHLPTVPLIEASLTLDHTVDELVAYSDGPSALNPDTPREGVVLRPLVEMKDRELGRLSFKVINPSFLLKYDA